MDPALSATGAATPGGLLLVAAVMLPFVGVLAMLALGGRAASRAALAVLPAGLALAVAIVAGVLESDAALRYELGGFAPPLGIALRADGISAAMLAITALLVCAVAACAWGDFRRAPARSESRQEFVFFALLLSVWGGLNALFVGADLFNLYVAIELLTFASVPLVSLRGGAGELEAALRYLLFALIGSMLYLLGAALLYGAHGTLDVALLAERIRPELVTWVAVGSMTAGLLAKTALFPLHLWLPPAHAGAPPPASALLSGLVIKGFFFLVVRLWFDVLPAAPAAGTQMLAGLGAAAILFGSVIALRQTRLKLLIAYSTVAQIGYLFLMFPLVAPSGGAESPAWTGGWLQLSSHAFAKASMFLAAGLIAEAVGHDRIDGLRGVGLALPTPLFAFGLAGLSLMGLPPSGGFVAKWLLVSTAIEVSQWWWALVGVAGGMFTGAYVFRVLARALARADAGFALRAPRRRGQELVVLALALASVLLGVLPLGSFGLLRVGRLVATGVAP